MAFILGPEPGLPPRWRRGLLTYTQTKHVLGQSNIEVAGAFVTSETYFVAYHVRPDGACSCLDVAAGRYVDLLEQRQNEWRIKDRTVVIEWTETRAGLENATLSVNDFYTWLS